MHSHFSDTSPDIERVQVSLMQKAGVVRRTACMRSLSRTMANLSRRAIRRAHPEYAEPEVDLAFVRLHYGDDMAGRLKVYISREIT